MNRMMKRPHPPFGVALLEALVALGVLAFVVLGLLALQLRSHTDGQLAMQRVMATRLALDLFERIKANPGGAAVLKAYLTPIDPKGPARDDLADCQAQGCDPQALAAWDLDQWHRQVGRDLPMGRATVFLPDGAGAQFGVLLGWRANEAVSDAGYLAPLSASVLLADSPLRCPERQICQLLYSAP